jgi:hypothetical protein
MSDTLSDARNRVRDLRTQARDRDCRGFWPDVVEWLCDQLEAAWKVQAPPAPATSAPTVEQIQACFTAMRAGQPLWRCISACREYEKVHGRRRECAVCQVERLEAAVLALYADTRQPQTEPTPTPAYLRRASVLVNAPAVLRLRSIRAGMAAEGRTNTLLSAETIDEVLALFAPAAPTPEPQEPT